jgi:hypothetical protein
MVTDEKHLDSVSPTFYQELLDLQDEMLGPMHLRSDEAPTKLPDGSFKGGGVF